MDGIIEEVITVVRTWKEVARAIGISNKEQDIMAKAFNVPPQ
jgi:serine/threonine-protein kinase HipA